MERGSHKGGTSPAVRVGTALAVCRAQARPGPAGTPCPVWTGSSGDTLPSLEWDQWGHSAQFGLGQLGHPAQFRLGQGPQGCRTER